MKSFMLIKQTNKQMNEEKNPHKNPNTKPNQANTLHCLIKKNPKSGVFSFAGLCKRQFQDPAGINPILGEHSWCFIVLPRKTVFNNSWPSQEPHRQTLSGGKFNAMYFLPILFRFPSLICLGLISLLQRAPVCLHFSVFQIVSASKWYSILQIKVNS